MRSLMSWALAGALLGLGAPPSQAQPSWQQTREQLIELNGQRVQMAVSGPISAPAVLFENGLDMTLDGWRYVLPLLSQQALLIRYNRPGSGRSTDDGSARRSAPICEHLRAVLAAAGAEPPFVLVGHSLGGLYVQACARRMPELVAGLVLVDPAVRGQEALLRRHDRFGAVLLGALQGTLPGAAGRELQAAAAVEAEIAALPVFDRGPVLTLVAGHDRLLEDRAFKNARRAAMREQTLQYPQGEVIEVEGGHLLTEEQPRAIADAVLRILQRGAAPQAVPALQAAQAEARSMRLPVVWRTR